ncbi:TIGR04283 family arsenosugar biosynthesis glycosyltransferase [Maribacter sp. HTCC2170]|uniref:TIGR04283 family arsenosugar biosynthesis glycosyltransferase n=1 Tax=Maribacter sp. (strain HTCC2170 / KCCM 42371) TaxID=313603 RepID=UPI00006AE5F3|nr:TIGR04283 family arsenosugar biosynthesis glycosyltransferase [Maribacter sp. HTCC2170]EAR00506.1 glycosyl transferase [Maribacter sp. HTCC2170]
MKNNVDLSIIIPTLNEAINIGQLIDTLRANLSNSINTELLIIDGGSNDATVHIAQQKAVQVFNGVQGRARQMNLGAEKAKGKILYFLHADTTPPVDFDKYILNAISTKYEAGCFQMKFDSKSWFLNFFAWFTRYNYKLCRGGDQSLFITKKLFNKTKGFNEDYIIFEDNEFIGRLYQQTSFNILPQYVRTSARKYDELGTIKLQYHFGIIHLKNYLGAGPDKLYDYYKRKIVV